MARGTLAIPGAGGETARGYWITVKLKITQGDRSETTTTTYHEFKVNGHWRFTVPQKSVDQCKPRQ
jgi:hypothetical protein